MKVLVVEDNEADAEMVTVSLHRVDREIDVTAVSSITDAKTALDSDQYDIALLDLSLPDSYGLGSIKELQRLSEALPIVVLSGDDSEHTALSAARLGVEDYVAKGDFIGAPFIRTLRYAIERKKGEQRLRDLADYDQLTRLSNRQRFNRQLLKAIGHAERSGELMALLFIDLNEFKEVNDTLGHHAGDELLSQVAMRFRNCVRAGDLVGRLGGDEFAILAEAISSPYDAEIVANKVIESLQLPFVLGGHSVTVGASVGISLFPHDASDAEELLTRADVAMYQAKRNSSNDVLFYSSRLNETADARNRRMQELSQAIAKEQFMIHYQPKACAQSHELVGLEALVRWQHPIHGLIEPEDFIPFAEENGMVSAIDQWVLQRVTDDIVDWQRQSLDVVPVAINVSASYILRSDLLASVQGLIESTGVEPELIQFDLTESVLHAEYSETREALEQLQEMGVGIWLNDFGTGYSAMSYLNDFPLNGLCIARSFVNTLGDRNTDAIVRSIVTLAHNLQLKVAGVGVETKAQLRALKALGCDAVQGNYYGEPMQIDGVREHFLRDRKDTVTAIMRSLPERAARSSAS